MRRPPYACCSLIVMGRSGPSAALPSHRAARSIREPELEKIPKRLDPVLPVDLLALRIGAAEVLDSGLVDAPLARAAYLGRDLHLASEVGARDLQSIVHGAR